MLSRLSQALTASSEEKGGGAGGVLTAAAASEEGGGLRIASPKDGQVFEEGEAVVVRLLPPTSSGSASSLSASLQPII